MPQIVRLEDTSDHGGKMVSASATFTVNGKIACVNGDSHDCPRTGHGTTGVTSSSTVTSNGRSIIRTGDRAGCGAILTTGSPNTTTD